MHCSTRKPHNVTFMSQLNKTNGRCSNDSGAHIACSHVRPFRSRPPLDTQGPWTQWWNLHLLIASTAAAPAHPFFGACVAATDKRTVDKRKRKLWWETHCRQEDRTSAQWKGTRRSGERRGGGQGMREETVGEENETAAERESENDYRRMLGWAENKSCCVTLG